MKKSAKVRNRSKILKKSAKSEKQKQNFEKKVQEVRNKIKIYYLDNLIRFHDLIYLLEYI